MSTLSRWIEDNVRVPSGISAVSGPLKLHPYQRGIADAIADPKVERVSVLKSASNRLHPLHRPGAVPDLG